MKNKDCFLLIEEDNDKAFIIKLAIQRRIPDAEILILRSLEETLDLIKELRNDVDLLLINNMLINHPEFKILKKSGIPIKLINWRNKNHDFRF